MRMIRMNKLMKRVLTLGMLLTLFLPILQSSQALALTPSETAEEMTADQWNQKMQGAMALATGDPAEYELLWEPNRAKAAVHAIALSPDERLLAVGGGHISGDNEIHLYYWTGSQWTHIWAAGDGVIDGSVLAVEIDDMDGDGVYEIVAGSAGGHVYVYSLRTGNPDLYEQKAVEVYQLAWRSANEITHRIWSIAIDDLDEDNIKEIIVGAGDGVHVFEYFTRSGYRNALGYSQEYIQVWTSGIIVKLVRAVATGDTDGDGFKEIIAGSEDHRVYIFENTEDVWSAWPPHADNAYVLRWDSGRQLFGPIQALAVGNVNPDTPADEIIVSAYGHGVFVFEQAPLIAQLVSTLLITGMTSAEVITLAKTYGPAMQTLGAPGMQPNQAIQPIAQPIVQQPIQPIVAQPVLIQPVQPVQPSDIETVDIPGAVAAPGLAITYIKDRIMTMTKLFRPLEPWESTEEYDGIPAPYPIDIYTDWSVGTAGSIKDPYEGEYPLEANSAMTRKPDGVLGRISNGGTVVLDFGQFEKVTGGGNSAPDLTVLLGTPPEVGPIYQAVEVLQPAESVIPVGQLQPLKVVDPVAPIIQVGSTEPMVTETMLPLEEVAIQPGAKSASASTDALASKPIQPNQEYIIIQPVEPTPIKPIITEPVVIQPVLAPLSMRVANVSITPVESIQKTQPFLTPTSPVRSVELVQPVSPALTRTAVKVDKIQPIQPIIASDAILELAKQQSLEIAIGQNETHFAVVPSELIKEAEWTLGKTLTHAPDEVEVLPSYVIDIDPILVAHQWDSFRYLRLHNTGTTNIYVDTAYGILYRPLAETLSIHLAPMNLVRPNGGIVPSEYDDRDVIVLGTQDGRLIFYDYQGVQDVLRIYDTFEDSLFSLGTGIWDFVSVTESAHQGFLAATYPAIHWVEVFQKDIGGTIYWRANNAWNNLERLKDWTFGEAVEIADPDGDGHYEIVAGSWDNNIYLFENIYNGTYYDAWSSPDLSHAESGEFSFGFLVGGLAPGIPYAYRFYDETVDMVVGNTDGDEANEIIVATTRSILIFENRATEVNPNLYELAWRGDFTQDAKYEITGLALGDDMDRDGAPEIVVMVGNKVYVLESAALYVPPELLQPIQPVLNPTNPKLQPIYAEPIAVEPIVEQPVQPIIVQPIINPSVQPIVQPPAVQQPIVQPKTQQEIRPIAPQPSLPQLQPVMLQPATYLQLVYNHYLITYEWEWDESELPPFDSLVVTRMMTEDIDSDENGEIIIAGISGVSTGVFNAAIMLRYIGFIFGLESTGNDRYQLKWTVSPGIGRPVTALAVDDQDGDGLKELICGTRDIAIFEHTSAGANDALTIRREPGSDIGWVGALGVGDSDGDGRREILVAATNASETGSNLPRNIISVLELKPQTTFTYDLQFNDAFREPVNVKDMAIGDTNNNGYDEIVCSAPGGFIFAYEYAASIEVTELFLVGQFVVVAYAPVYREVVVAETETLKPANQVVLQNATLIQQAVFVMG